MPLKLPLFSRVLTCFLILLFTLEVHAFAAEIPEDALVIDYANCMTGCTEYEGQLGCEVLCGCTMQRFQDALTEEKYLVLKEELANNEVSLENRIFLDETANMCVAEMDRIMAEFFLDIPDQGEKILPPPEDDDGGK